LKEFGAEAGALVLWMDGEESELRELSQNTPYSFKKGDIVGVIRRYASAKGRSLAENSKCCDASPYPLGRGSLSTPCGKGTGSSDRAIGRQNNRTRHTGRVEGISENGDIVLTEHLGTDRQNLGEMGRIERGVNCHLDIY
jgi:hypothetical protein